MKMFHTHISPQAIEIVTETLHSGFVSEGERVKQFEEQLTQQLGLVRPVAVNSGTSALHLALVLAGVGSGGEVILPAQTFVATGSAILMSGACPIFADIQPHTGNLDPASIRQRITTKTKAIMPVHWGGYPCNLDEINTIAREYNLAVIEDAAHALGATYKGKPIGAISRFTAFSFQAIKHITTGDGGALCCCIKKDAELAFIKRWFGIDRANSKPSILGEREYDIADLGYKYHMNDIAASIGLGNLTEFSRTLARRQEIGAFYRKQLADVSGIELLRHDTDRTHAYWLFTILVEKREDFIRKLATEDIPASVVHMRIDRNSIFGAITPDLSGQDKFDRCQVSLPIHEGLSEEDVDLVVSTIRKGW